MQETVQELKNIFDQIRSDFEPLGALTVEERQRQNAIRERIADHPEETSMISGELGGWFQTDKMNPLKIKLRDRFNEIAPTGDTRGVIIHFRASIVGRLQRLLPELYIQNLNLLGETLNNVNARQRLCRQISQNIHNSEGLERERQVHAFELITALQALYQNDPTSDRVNPLSMARGENRYREWLSYMYLASQFFEPGDITFAKEEGETDQAYQDRVFQFLVRTVSDIIRGHNEDHWEDDPYYPQNAPSCAPGATGRLLMSGSWHKGLTLFTPTPIFNDPTKAVDAAIVSQLLQGLANGSLDDSKKLLTVLNEIGQGEIIQYAFRDFFTWDEGKKTGIAERIANDLIREWTEDLSRNDKLEVSRRHKEEIKRLILEKINHLLTHKYTTQYPPQGDLVINQGMMERFKEGALSKLFSEESSTHRSRCWRFLAFYELPGIMNFYCKEKGQDAALKLWRSLPDFKENLIQPRVTPQYLQLLVDWVVASKGERVDDLYEEEKDLLRQILLVDDKDKKNLRKVSLRQNLLKDMNWEQLVTMLGEVLGANWKNELINSNLSDYLLKTLLVNKQYADFSEMSIALYKENPVVESRLLFWGKFEGKIQEILSNQWRERKVDLLTYLRMHRGEVFDSEAPEYADRVLDITSEFLKNLEFSDLQYLLDEVLKNDPETLGKIIKDLRIEFPYKKQIEILAYLETAEGIGEGSLTYINLIKDRNLRTENEGGQAVIRKAQECWNNICTRARQNKDLETCQVLWKIGAEEEIKRAAVEAVNAVRSEEDVELKAQKREDLSFWLSFLAEQGVAGTGLGEEIRLLYWRFYSLENDSESCRLFLPLLRGHPEYYNLLSGNWRPSLRNEPRRIYDFLSQVIYGVENKALFVFIMHRQVGTMEGPNFLNKLTALSHLIVSPLSRMEYPGDDEEVRQLHQWVQEELNKLIEPQLNHLIAGDLPTEKQTKLSEITGDLVAKFTDYFAELPENPRTAFEEIIREAQESVNEKLGTAADFDLRSFLLNALLVLLTGGLALIPILINKALCEPDFFSNEMTMPKDHLKKTFKGLNVASSRFFARREEGASEEAAVFFESLPSTAL